MNSSLKSDVFERLEVSKLKMRQEMELFAKNLNFFKRFAVVAVSEAITTVTSSS